MEEVLHANIFFFVTGIAVIIISAILCVVLYQTIRVLKSVRKILSSLERGTEAISEDFQTIRSYFERGGLIGGLSMLFGRPIASTRKRTTKRTTKKKSELKIKDIN